MFARSYTGAKASRLLAGFLSTFSTADKEIRSALRTLRNRSRQLSWNELFAQRALLIFRTNVVGEKMGKVSAWYDNEWGFASRMCDLAKYIHKI